MVRLVMPEAASGLAVVRMAPAVAGPAYAVAGSQQVADN